MNAITVIVYNSRNSNRPVKGVTVKGYYPGGFVGVVPTASEKTDGDGRCVITWESDMRKLKSILIAGEEHKGEFKVGNTYTFTTNRA